MLFSIIFSKNITFQLQFTANKILFESNICGEVESFVIQDGFFFLPFIMSRCLWVDFCFESASCSHWHYQDLYENKEWKMNSFQRLQVDGTISSLLLMLYNTPWVFISYQKFYSCRDQFEDPLLSSFPLQKHCQISKNKWHRIKSKTS